MLTIQQQVERRGFLGSSDVAAVLGLSSFASPYDVWLDKTGQLEPSPGGPASDAGDRLEPIILDWAEQQLGPLQRKVFVARPDLYLGSHCDSILASTGNPVEAKSSGITGRVFGEWGAEYTDEVPEVFLVQGHVQLICTESDLCWLPALLGGRGFCLFKIERSDSLCEAIIEKSVAWWERHIIGGVPPVDSAPSLEVSKRRRRVSGKAVPVSADVVAEYEALSVAVRDAEELRDAKKAAMLAELGDAEIGDFGDPDKVLTFFETKRRAYTVAESAYRSPRIVKRSNVSITEESVVS